MGESSPGAELVLRYARAVDVAKDRLGEVRHGLIVRTKIPLAPGDRPRVVIELAHEKVTLRLEGEVRWVTPLVNGALAGVGLRPGTHRDEVQLDLLFGHRTAGAAPDPAPLPPPPPPAPAAAPGRPLSVAMLQPNAVLRQVLAGALARFGKERGNREVAVDARADADGFLEALASEDRGLAIIDCDVLGPAADPLLAAIRSHDDWQRLPVILLSSEARTRVEDTYAVFLSKPVVMKSFVDLVGILVGSARA